MTKTIKVISVLIGLLFITTGFGQSSADSVKVFKDGPLFSSKDMLPVKLIFSLKDLKKETNDSTYIKSKLAFQLEDGVWETLDIELRERGNYRLKNCYFPPIKIKIDKKIAKGTLFESHKRLKLVIPCLTEKDKNDNVVKEYLAYKLFELVSPYYFKTRMVDLELTDIRGKKNKVHTIKGFLIEDDKHVAKRIDGKVYDRNVHPMQQEAVASVRNALFQFMIGNTDFSQAYQHNIKLIFIGKNIVPVPFDFDMAGLVNCSYAVVSQIGNETLNLGSVEQRLYRGFKRDPQIFQQIRQEFLDQQENVIAALDECEVIFDDPREFKVARNYILEFFEVLRNDKKYRSEILNKARTN